MLKRLSQAMREANGWFYRTFLPHKVTEAARQHIGVDLAKQRFSDWAVDAVYRVNPDGTHELVSRTCKPSGGTEEKG